MSQDAVVSRKEKKAQRDAERHRKGKKRKQDESEVTGDQAHVAENEKNVLALETGEAEAPAKAPQSKKRKASENDEEGGPEDVAPKENSEGKAKAQQKKRKKQKTDTTEGAVETGEADAASKDRKDRFVVFIGNLPYDTTDASLRAHFKKLEPFILRHRLEPKTKKSKGFAFLEFENYDRMKTCLKIFHHSFFDPEEAGKEDVNEGHASASRGRAKKQKGRRINVELTAGGGGKKESRMEKIKAKNIKLEEQRRRRIEQEKKEKARDERKGGAARKAKHPKDEVEKAADMGGDTGGIHPSRLARMQG
ncbi:hypothetical protein KC343_g1424 [Hortaea werneckii]|uniref:RRM domain-containing protein n=1 Tax=Hortaea werneckii TaxID=91943 RepID=A0A3M7H0A2_HORWE|nr:hypothetical protein KC323_g4009 [Hortaea werneckii]KAI7255642.1 hypothetical protein KC352_g11486 [Hortaea werneckii]KAI7349856.1 hypothetical protein KC320_g5823 [Hortaea werneckii]KAI7636156.1 hypothetical protein KC343_g1424 [Hortaea werneckii]KAI7682136.1 hypothetical protein KC319_g1183 [Hortaea werneckii]